MSQAKPGYARRPEGMSDLDWLVAIEEIRQLHAYRDRCMDAHDWEAYAAIHAPEHVSHHARESSLGLTGEAWRSVDEMMRNVKRQLPEGFHTVHHSYDPEIRFDTPVKARAIWAMTDGIVSTDANGDPYWAISYGYYYESYEKRDGRWLYTSRRWQRYLGVEGREDDVGVKVIFPGEPLHGADAFDHVG